MFKKAFENSLTGRIGNDSRFFYIFLSHSTHVIIVHIFHLAEYHLLQTIYHITIISQLPNVFVGITVILSITVIVLLMLHVLKNSASFT